MRTSLRRLSHRRCLASLFLTLWILLVAGAAEARPAAEKLDRIIPRVMKGRRIPGVAALVVRNGVIVWQREYGFADVTNQIPVAADTMFMMASVSKTVTAVAMMALGDDGAVALDDPIDAYLPFPVRNPKFPATPITVRMLLTHTSSIADGPKSFDSYVRGDSPIPLETFLDGYLTPGGATYDPDNFLDTAPGERYEYSNEGTALLGERRDMGSDYAYRHLRHPRPLGPLPWRPPWGPIRGLRATRHRVIPLQPRR
jgi:CubicO group peptidase (beta-lactamase class C family)